MRISKLLEIASPPIGASLASGRQFPHWRERGPRFEELARLLAVHNGFYAFEAALHLFPEMEDRIEGSEKVGLQAWNAAAAWRDSYGDLLDGIFFFAEDVFGGQFGIRDDEIVTFEPEAGDIELMAHNLDDWAGRILSDYSQLTGYPLAHAWQSAHGPIPPGKRLLPKRPFILGGPFDEGNLFAVDAIKGMRYRGDLWQQLRDLPDGAQVRLKPLPLQ